MKQQKNEINKARNGGKSYDSTHKENLLSYIKETWRGDGWGTGGGGRGIREEEGVIREEGEEEEEKRGRRRRRGRNKRRRMRRRRG